MLAKLNGIFAFAIWDARDQSLFLARDAMGVKPLYYAQNDAGFLFASELKALTCHPQLDTTLDVEAILSHLTYLWCPAPHTMLESVRKLEPGHALLVRHAHIVRSWQFQELCDGRVDRFEGDERSAVLAVRRTVTEAVERQMVADVPVGAFLSGGVDSSAIVALAKNFTDSRLQCFTIDSNQHEGDDGFSADLPHARRVAEFLDVDLHCVQAGPEIAYQLEEMVWHLDEPLADPAAINTLLISGLAAQMGIKVLLSGTGGDDVFSGYSRHRALELERYWSGLPTSARRLLAAAVGRLPPSQPSFRRISKAFRYAALAGDDRILSYFYWLDPQRARSLLCDDFLGRAADVEMSERLSAQIGEMPAQATSLDKMLFLDKKYYLADHNLLYTDKMTMANGVEARVPLLDRDLVALAASLPDHYKQRGSVGKWVFKEAMRPYLPESILTRPKTGFSVPLRFWLKNELREFVADNLSETSLKRTGIFSHKAVTALMHDDASGRIDATFSILSMVCIQNWCDRFLR